MSHKGFSANTNKSLIENDAIINDQTGVVTVLNDYYVNVTESIGQPDLLDVNENIDVFLAHESHESVQYGAKRHAARGKATRLLGGSGACSTEKIFKNGAIWSVLESILLKFCQKNNFKNSRFFYIKIIDMYYCALDKHCSSDMLMIN